MLLRWLLGVCSIRVLGKNHGDPYYEPTVVVHDICLHLLLWSVILTYKYIFLLYTFDVIACLPTFSVRSN